MQKLKEYESVPDSEYNPNRKDGEIAPADAPAESFGEEERPPDVPVEN